MEHKTSKIYEEMLESTIKSIERNGELIELFEKQFGKNDQTRRLREELTYIGTVNMAVKASLEQERTGRVFMNINYDFWSPVNERLPEVKLYNSEYICDYYEKGPSGELIPMNFGGTPVENPIYEELFESASVLVTGDWEKFDGHTEHGVFFARYQEVKENGELVESRWYDAFDGDWDIKNVTAWMPLPEAFTNSAQNFIRAHSNKGGKA